MRNIIVAESEGIEMPGAMESTMIVKGTVSIECPNCGHEHEWSLLIFIDKFGWDLSKWEEKQYSNLECEECEYHMGLEGPEIIGD